MHWPGSTYMIIPGFILTVVWFSRGLYQTDKSETGIISDENILDDDDIADEGHSSFQIIGKVFFGIATVLVVLGSIFKIMHWPYASPLLVSGICIGVVWFIYDMFKPVK